MHELTKLPRPGAPPFTEGSRRGIDDERVWANGARRIRRSPEGDDALPPLLTLRLDPDRATASTRHPLSAVPDGRRRRRRDASEPTRPRPASRRSARGGAASYLRPSLESGRGAEAFASAS